MQRIDALIFQSAIRRRSSRWSEHLRHVWNTLTRSADERFLCEACDLADLECRMRRLERGVAPFLLSA